GIGFWSLCNYDLISLFTYSLRAKSLIEYTSFYIAPLFVLLYFWGDKFVTRYRVVKIIYYILVAAQVILDVTAFTMQITGIMHFPAFLRIQHIILFALCFLIIMQTIYDCIKKQLNKKILILGMTIMLIVGMLDMVHFLLEKYYMVSDDIHYTSIMCIGTMIFVLSQLADFGVGIGNIFLQGAKTKILEQMAYVDEMTGLANRRKCEEIWDKLDDESSDYGIFSFDLNFLKKTNDTKGHAKGDLLIKSLADVLKNVFSDVGEVGRIGGDEYIVFIWDVKKADIEKHTHNLEEEIKKVNTENPELNLSTSYGFCSHKQYPELDSRHLYRKADALMYEMKLAMKAERKD
ncbi:MAG: GGDEF domain-containing protein, partial [Lachnospiraceae bacterium]|nr:GGDEF domain-containing protein [Lachnospiraceae bacterium]